MSTAIATSTAIAAIAVGTSRVELPTGMMLSDRLSKSGKVLGSRLTFTGMKSAADLRAEGRRSGLKGKSLDAYVNKSLRGDVAAAAWVRHDAVMSGLRSAGVVPTDMCPNKAGTKFKTEYVMAEDVTKPVVSLAQQLVDAGKFATLAEAEAFLA
jgi:hypothetical protein